MSDLLKESRGGFIHESMTTRTKNKGREVRGKSVDSLCLFVDSQRQAEQKAFKVVFSTIESRDCSESVLSSYLRKEKWCCWL